MSPAVTLQTKQCRYACEVTDGLVVKAKAIGELGGPSQYHRLVFDPAYLACTAVCSFFLARTDMCSRAYAVVFFDPNGSMDLAICLKL